MKKALLLFSVLCAPFIVFAGEADLELPDFKSITFFNGAISGWSLLLWGSIIVILGLLFGLYQAINIKKYPVHKSMANISATIYETCKTYLLQQISFARFVYGYRNICHRFVHRIFSDVDGLV